MPIKVAIMYRDEDIEWDEACDFGRVSWSFNIVIPLGHPARAFLPKLKRGMTYLQSRYDLGVVAAKAEQPAPRA